MEFVSVTWDTKYLSLPNDRMILLKTYDSIPLRPTARIDLLFDPVEKAILCMVREGDNENVAAKETDSGLLLPSGKDSWGPFSPSRLASTPAEAACLAVLRRSDVFCGSQAHTDFHSASVYPFWDALLADMRALLPAACVMLS